MGGLDLPTSSRASARQLNRSHGTAPVAQALVNYEFIIDIACPEYYIARRPPLRMGGPGRCWSRPPRCARRAPRGAPFAFAGRGKRRPSRRLKKIGKSKTPLFWRLFAFRKS